jgi:anthraniloyl-CoA monooxygenase
MPAETEAGTFVAHCYPYDRGVATLVIEASQQTLDRAGFTDRAFAAARESDDQALAYLSRAFSPLLQGAPLLGNRSRWTHFTTLRCSRWHCGKAVLLGDAVATVHPSLGSGTKVAMEGAIALANAIDACGDEPITAALPVFERTWRPKVERLQDAALRSQLWWESFATRSGIPPARLAVAYLSRAGALSLTDLAATMPELARQACAEYGGAAPSNVRAGELTRWVLDTPFEAGSVRFARRLMDGSAHAGEVGRVDVDCQDPWGAKADAYVERARDHVRAGASLIRLDGGHGRAAALDRLAIAERIRQEVPACVGITVDSQDIDLAATGLVAGRADLVWTRG